MQSIFMRLLDEESLAINLLAFHMIDEDNSGQLDVTEMRVAIERLRAIMPELAFTDEDVDATFDKLDVDKTGLITFSQFVFATLDPQLLADDSKVEMFFRDLDSLKEGFLTQESL